MKNQTYNSCTKNIIINLLKKIMKKLTIKSNDNSEIVLFPSQELIYQLIEIVQLNTDGIGTLVQREYNSNMWEAIRYYKQTLIAI